MDAPEPVVAALELAGHPAEILRWEILVSRPGPDPLDDAGRRIQHISIKELMETSSPNLNLKLAGGETIPEVEARVNWIFAKYGARPVLFMWLG